MVIAQGLIKLIPGLAVLLLTSACQPDASNKALNSIAGKLIGGSTSNAHEYEASLRILGGCTAAKIGPRLILTAAHCVVDRTTGNIRANYAADKPLYLETQFNSQAHKVEKTLAHSSYINAVKKAIADGHSPNNVGKHSFDVAVIITKDEITDAVAADVDFDTVMEGESLIIGGYGCEDKLGGKAPSPPRYKVGKTKTVGMSALDGAQGNYANAFTRLLIYGHNMITQGQRLNPAVPSICPGDSGGPVYRADDRFAVVGVNAYYSFNDSTGISRTNWHTRLSGVQDWLKPILLIEGN